MYNYNEKKSVVLIDKNCSKVLAINAIAHLAFSMGAKHPGNLGIPLHKLSDSHSISGITKYPHIIKKATSEKIKNVCKSIELKDNLSVFLFTDEMLKTGHDDELRDALSKTSLEQLFIHAAIIFGETSLINKYTNKFSLLKE